MTISKSIGNTFLFIIVLNLTSSWLFLDIPFEFETILILDSLFSPFLNLFFILSYLGFTQNSDFLSIKRTSIHYYILGFILGIIFVFAQSPLNMIYDKIFSTDYTIIYSFEPKNILKWSALSSVLIIPIYEEFFFRKFIQKALQKTFHPVLSILFASTLFSSIHLPFHYLLLEDYVFSIHHTYITFFGGLFLGGLFFKSKSIGPSIFMHSIWNFVTYIL